MGSFGQNSTSLIRFGGEFELDLRAYELRRSGHPLKLERIPLEILRLLLERHGQLVTRDEIVERIWRREVFVDTDNSINGAIRKIRQVLEDDSGQPRFVQTVTGKGYRFIAVVAVNDLHLSRERDTDSQESTKPAAGTPCLANVRPRQENWRIGPGFAVVGIALVLVATGIAYMRWFRPQPASQANKERTMLAVLPFENLTGDASQDYFSDGLTEEMIAQLGRLDPQHLGLIARTSVMHYKGSTAPLEQIGRELGVQYVLESSVRRDSGKVRISAQLIQMKDQTHLWARQYDRELSNLLVLQSEIAQEIADEIQTSLGGRKPVKASSASPALIETGEAYDLYLKGQYFWNKRTLDGFQHAIDYYQQAIAKDPNSARAYAGLADTYALLSSSALQQSEFMPKAPRRSGPRTSD